MIITSGIISGSIAFIKGREKIMQVCLNMIVRNEAHCIEETLDSIRKYISAYYIVDTGSTDDTVNVIKNKLKDLPGEVVTHDFRSCECHPEPEYKDHSWFHFGHNRTFAIREAVKWFKGDYFFVMDADDIVHGEIVFPTTMKADSYLTKFGNSSGFYFVRCQFLRNDPELMWRYVEPLHEVLNSESKGFNFTKELINGNYYIQSRRLGARNKNPKKYIEDARILEESLLKEPKNARQMFYAAQSFLEAKEYSKALLYFLKRTDIPPAASEEVFLSYVNGGHAMEKLKLPWQGLREKMYLRAAEVFPWRAPEALIHIIRYYREGEKNVSTAYNYARFAMSMPDPSSEKCGLFIQGSIYSWAILEELAGCAFLLGRHQEAYHIFQRCLKRVSTEENRQRIKGNLKVIEQRLAHESHMNKQFLSVLLMTTIDSQLDFVSALTNNRITCVKILLDMFKDYNETAPEFRGKAVEILKPVFDVMAEETFRNPEVSENPKKIPVYLTDKEARDDDAEDGVCILKTVDEKGKEMTPSKNLRPILIFKRSQPHSEI